MISRLHIFSSLLLLPGLASGATFSGKIELRDSRERSVQREHDYSGVVVWLEPVNSKPPDPAGPPKATMLQRNKRFIPHVLPVRRGTAIDFPNLDPIFHNAFSNFSGQIFDVGLYKPGSTRTVMFNRPGVVRVFCNIHAAMSAVIVVVNTPWFATTEPDGSFRVQNVPPGDYLMRVFHERATSAELAKAEKKITIGVNGGSAQVNISESGYLPVPHLNKHGKTYTDSGDNYQVLK